MALVHVVNCSNKRAYIVKAIPFVYASSEGSDETARMHRFDESISNLRVVG